MSGYALLDFFAITDTKTYHRWCLEYHPDRVPLEKKRDATRQFQKVSNEWRNFKDSGFRPVPKPSPRSSQPTPQYHSYKFYPSRTNPWINNPTGDQCTATVDGTPHNRCYHRTLVGADTCFYHKDNNIRFAEKPHAAFFGVLSQIQYYEILRTEKMCVARNKGAKTWCRNHKQPNSNYCTRHKITPAAYTGFTHDAF
jgi:hypothetical protein